MEKPIFYRHLARFKTQVRLVLTYLGAKIFMARKRKKKMISGNAETPKVNLTEQIKSAAEGLWYISETDAEIFPFTGSKTDSQILLWTGFDE